MDTIQIVVPVPDNPILWVGLAIFSVLLGFRLIAGIWAKVRL